MERLQLHAAVAREESVAGMVSSAWVLGSRTSC
jgi:hypothetical protein